MPSEVVETGPVWGGLDRKRSAASLKLEVAAESSNCAHWKDRPGLLGPRRGKTTIHPTAYAATVVGLIPFDAPEDTGSRWAGVMLVATSDGTVQTVERSTYT